MWTDILLCFDAAVAGNDAFGKKHFKNTPIPKTRSETEEYFYAGIVTPALHYCMGGISIDGSGRVLRNDGSVFNGLFAAGEATGGLHGVNRLGGNALTECIVFGRVVGEIIELKEEESSCNIISSSSNTTSGPASTSMCSKEGSSKDFSSEDL